MSVQEFDVAQCTRWLRILFPSHAAFQANWSIYGYENVIEMLTNVVWLSAAFDSHVVSHINKENRRFVLVDLYRKNLAWWSWTESGATDVRHLTTSSILALTIQAPCVLTGPVLGGST